MNVNSTFLAREKEKAEIFESEYSGTHSLKIVMPLDMGKSPQNGS
jgi:hypothetical protein